MSGDGLGQRLPRPTDRQCDVIYLDADRDQVVLGTAGSGKTLMAVHRAVYLADTLYEHSGRTLLVTYNKALVSYLTHLVGGTSDGVDVRSYHHVARGYLASRGRLNGYRLVLDGNARDAVMHAALREVSATLPPTTFLSRPVEFFLDELDWISGHGYHDRDGYLSAKRSGRLEPLLPAQRKLLWKVRAEYLRLRTNHGQLFDWWDLPTAMRNELNDDERERYYQHIVIDEAQDLPPEAIRSLVDLVAPGGSITLFADYAQQLYGQRTSYRKCGLKIRKAEPFVENFRNSVGIAKLAIATAELPHFTQSTDLVTPNAPTVSGTPPTLFRAADHGAELEAVRAQAMELGATGSVAILARTWQEAESYARGLVGVRRLTETRLWSDDPGICIGTYHSAKGLEFDTVILPGLNEDCHPSAAQVEAFGEGEAVERVARLLYVGITRARAELLATYTGVFTGVLPGPASGYWLLAGAGPQ